MTEQTGMVRKGRPPKRTEPYRRTAIELPVRQLTYLATVPNRVDWLIDAIDAKMERESIGLSSRNKAQ